MGRSKRNRNKQKENEPVKFRDPSTYTERAPPILENASFEKYYREQGILPLEFDEFMACLKTSLPVTFRFTGNRSYASDLRDFMTTSLFPNLEGIVLDGTPLKKPTSVNWYPDQFCWVFECDRPMLRKSLEVKEFHRFLVSETEVGNISRQELVSMIPVLLLDVKPSQYVLDMCASPGSKTAQLLEALHGKEGKFPDGLVIANDSDQSRCYTLVHQAKRLQSPCLIVTNHNAQTFPRLSPADHPSDALQFDRILCDVPCSGDGTLRKNPMIWRKWTPSDGNSLHKLQCQILHRGCELLKIGGRLVYSTCSFNPLENEAVIASILKESDGALRLVDVSDQLPSLIRYPGMKTWKVANKATDFFSTHAESDGAFLESMFPPANAESLGLEKAVRIYPFSQNSGGFFVACFEKVGAFGGIDRKSEWRLDSAGSTMKEEDSHVIKKQKVEQDTILKGNKESPFVFLPDDNPVLKKCREDYGLEGFPSGVFVVRSEDKQDDFSHIYVSASKAKMALQSNKLKVVNAGIKLFKKNAGKSSDSCRYRICSEGVATAAPYLPEARHLNVNLAELCMLIKAGYPKFDSFSEGTQRKLEMIEQGSCILRFDPLSDESYSGTMKASIVLPFYRAKCSVSLLLDKAERRSLLYRLTGEFVEVFEGLGNMTPLEAPLN